VAKYGLIAGFRPFAQNSSLENKSNIGKETNV